MCVRKNDCPGARVAVLLRRQLHSDTDSVLGVEGAGEKKERFVRCFFFLFLLVARSAERWNCSQKTRRNESIENGQWSHQSIYSSTDSQRFGGIPHL